jgi:two-component system response regulator GlrR
MSAGKILIVDDDANLLELMKTRVETAGYAVTTAFGADEAKAAAKSVSFDLSVVDMKLEGHDGISLMEELHENHPELPVII